MYQSDAYSFKMIGKTGKIPSYWFPLNLEEEKVVERNINPTFTRYEEYHLLNSSQHMLTLYQLGNCTLVATVSCFGFFQPFCILIRRHQACAPPGLPPQPESRLRGFSVRDPSTSASRSLSPSQALLCIRVEGMSLSKHSRGISWAEQKKRRLNHVRQTGLSFPGQTQLCNKNASISQMTPSTGAAPDINQMGQKFHLLF